MPGGAGKQRTPNAWSGCAALTLVNHAGEGRKMEQGGNGGNRGASLSVISVASVFNQFLTYLNNSHDRDCPLTELEPRGAHSSLLGVLTPAVIKDRQVKRNAPLKSSPRIPGTPR